MLVVSLPAVIDFQFWSATLTGLVVENDSPTSTMVGHRKPHRAGFHALAQRLGVQCAELLYVGNERKDVEGGNAAGCRTALVWRAPGEPPVWGQEVTLRSLDELRALVRHREMG